MNNYLNPSNSGFWEAVNSEIYVDKSDMISYINKRLCTEQKNICISRPRRFGKSMAAKMLTAYYSKGCDSLTLFQNLKIASDPSFSQHLNRHNVIFLNMQTFLSASHNAQKMISSLEQAVCAELSENFHISPQSSLSDLLSNIFSMTGEQFIFIIDEWDCIFREKRETTDGHLLYLDFLRNLLKDRTYVSLCYMTGILPIKKYGSHSALNMFMEFSMTNPRVLSEYVGFTEEEVRELCIRYHMDFGEAARWYDGYTFRRSPHIYSPKSIVDAMLNEEFDSYWTQTETYEALRIYIEMNFDGLRDSIVEMLAGNCVEINTATFQNDMTTFKNKDDVMTLLIHLGYLAYDFEKQGVFIPNYEVSKEFVNAVQGSGWNSVIEAIRQSEKLLCSVWEKDGDAVAEALEEAHFETSILTYNNENSLACAISLAFYSARNYYTEIRELPAGKGFADLVFLPRKNYLDKPAMVVELKWNMDARGAVSQIREKNYMKALEDYRGNILLVGISYDRRTKKHTCRIETA